MKAPSSRTAITSLNSALSWTSEMPGEKRGQRGRTGRCVGGKIRRPMTGDHRRELNLFLQAVSSLSSSELFLAFAQRSPRKIRTEVETASWNASPLLTPAVVTSNETLDLLDTRKCCRRHPSSCLRFQWPRCACATREAENSSKGVGLACCRRIEEIISTRLLCVVHGA